MPAGGDARAPSQFSEAEIEDLRPAARAQLQRKVHAVQKVIEVRVGAQGLLQLCVFRLGFLQDGDVAVSVFPQLEEIFISRARFGKGVGVRLWPWTARRFESW